jgi:hypothetical protein
VEEEQKRGQPLKYKKRSFNLSNKLDRPVLFHCHDEIKNSYLLQWVPLPVCYQAVLNRPIGDYAGEHRIVSDKKTHSKLGDWKLSQSSGMFR